MIAILIPVHNGLDFTKRALISINESICVSNQVSATFIIIVIDDGSTDGTQDWIKNNYPDVVVLNGTGDLWWGGAINLGMEYSRTVQDFDYVLFFNNDLIVNKNYFKILISAIHDYDKNTVLVSKVYYLDEPKKVFSMGGFFNPTTGLSYIINYKLEKKIDFTSPIKIDWFGGMGTLIPMDGINEVGYIDNKNFPHYKGDFDYALRLKKRGFNIIADPRLEIWNDHSNSGIRVSGFKSFLHTFSDKRSQFNIIENIRFYRLHTLPIIGWVGFAWKYFKHISNSIAQLIKGIQ